MLLIIANCLTLISMNIKHVTELITKKAFNSPLIKNFNANNNQYRPTPYLSHPFLQSVYNIYQPLFPYKFERQKIFFDDGGHISLDWCTKQLNNKNPPILFIMHGLTGGSQMNYIKSLMTQASQQGYKSVCLNSRGINNQMTSPVPFTAMQYGQLETALDRIQIYYPNSPIYMVGTSFGGNYLLRYVRDKKRNSIKGLITLAPPINVHDVVDDMPFIYQHFFVKRYIYEVVTKHPYMNFWQDIGIVDLDKVKKAKTLVDFHNQITVKILGLSGIEELFDAYKISEDDIRKLDVPIYMMLSKDDPIVSYKSMPLETIKNNKNIKLVVTQKGGHLCWFSGIIPKRWYPKPALQYLKRLHVKEYIV